ncbi:MAG: YbaB/EbfC family nucleoid-associated protein [Actinomycetia bacterium]|nr:YbaB/EbfC family nucleoid-associated protein [Actinomycetes bacterium]
MNYGNMMKQAKQMQKKMQEIQEELKKTEFEASSGGGAVKVKVNGEQEVLEVKINQDMVDADDLEMVEDMVVVAINDALSKSKQKMQEEMGALTGGMNIPGLF